jgi:hypothetical protein
VRESRWAGPVAAATFLAVALMVVSAFASAVSGTGEAAILRSVHEHGGSVTLSGLMQAVAFALLAVPLVYLFQADRARSKRVRPQMIVLMVAAPLLLGVSAGLSIGARQQAADIFVRGEAKPTMSKGEAHEKCVSDRKDEGAKDFGQEYAPAQGETALAACEKRKLADDEASNAVGEAALAPFVSGFGIVGGLGFAVALFYACLWAMRLGLLPRFWGALGMALGIATIIGLVLFTLIWFVYFGLLALGLLPNGRPPAWEAGEPVPWPTPGETAAAELEPEKPLEPEEALEAPEASEAPEPGDPSEPPSKRKRKQRD